MNVAVIDCMPSDFSVIARASEPVGAVCQEQPGVEAAIKTGASVIFVCWDTEHSGLRALETIHQGHERSIAVVVVFSRGGSLSRRRAFEAGSTDVLFSPLDHKEVCAEIQSLFGGEREADLERRLQFEVVASEMLLGISPRFKACVEQLRKATLVEGNVLLLGETGTGKDVFANALHRLGNRSSQPLLAVNCGALHGELLESELFGHVRGAFTGAHKDHAGRFEEGEGRNPVPRRDWRTTSRPASETAPRD